MSDLLPEGWIRPDWPVPPGVHALFTARGGGVSRSPHDSFNLGDHVGDRAEDVAENRRRLAQRLGVRPVFLQQVHGSDVVALDAATPDGTVADACVSTQPGVACTVMVADCLPVLWCHEGSRVLAASHAGWRGLAGVGGRGILESSFDALLAQVDMGVVDATQRRRVASQTLVWLGPCIGPSAFEVGADVREAFVSAQPETARFFQALAIPGKFMADLAGLARWRLQAMGIHRLFGNDSSDSWCTVSQTSRFFSHRRDAVLRGGSGRMAACLWRTF